MRKHIFGLSGLLVTVLLAGTGVAGEKSEGDLAKATQNPISDLISVPFQNNTNFDVGPNENTQNVLNIQPVWPVHLNDDWNLITRTILPVMSQPAMIPGDHRVTGFGDLSFTAFFSPRKASKTVWGVGPNIVVPTGTNKRLGTEKWSAGPSLVVLQMNGPWVYGALVSNVWSFAGDDDRKEVNQFLMQPFINYNLPNGWYLSSSPVITANWKAKGTNVWTVPLGGGVGKIVRIGKMPVNLSVQAFDYAHAPTNGPEWTLRLQMQLLFPKG